MKVQNIFTLLLMGCMSVGLNAVPALSNEDAQGLANHYLKRVAFGDELAGEKFQSKYAGLISYQSALDKIHRSQVHAFKTTWNNISDNLIGTVAEDIEKKCNKNNIESCVIPIIKNQITFWYNFCLNPNKNIREIR